jgi:DNA-binding NtrC family response regulator
MAGSLPDASSGEKPGLELPDDLSLSDAIEHLEHYYIPQTLSRHSGHKNQTADILGVDRKTLYRKLKKYEIG